jgi:GH24 family phage-related lysozyme (muramidase)
MPHLTVAAEQRAERIRVEGVQDVISNLGAHPNPNTTAAFAQHFDMLQALQPSKSSSEISSSLIGYMADIAIAGGGTSWRKFSKFLHDDKVIKTKDDFDTFAGRFPMAAAKLASQGWAAYTAQQTQESNDAAQALVSEIDSASSTDELTSLFTQVQQFGDQFGDGGNHSMLGQVWSEQAKAVAIQERSTAQWRAIGGGEATNLKTADYNMEQITRLIADPATDFTNVLVDDYAAVSTAAATKIANQFKAMGYVSKKVKTSISSMMLSRDTTTRLKGYQLLKKLEAINPSMPSLIMSEQAIAHDAYTRLSEGGVNSLELDQNIKNEDLWNALNDPEIITRHSESILTSLEADNDAEAFTDITADGWLFNNEWRKKVAAAQGVDADSIYFAVGSPVQKAFMEQLRVASISAEFLGTGEDIDDFVATAWAKLEPTLSVNQMGDNQGQIIIGQAATEIDYLSSLTEEGDVQTRTPFIGTMANPLNPQETISPLQHLQEGLQALSEMAWFGGADLGFQQLNDGSGKAVLTQKDEYGRPVNVVVGLDTFDLTGGWIMGKGEYGENKPVQANAGMKLTLTGDWTIDKESIAAVRGSLYKGMEFVPQYPAGATEEDIKSGQVLALDYKILVYPTIRDDQVPEMFHTDEVMEQLRQGGHVNPPIERPVELQGFDERPNKDHKWQDDQTITRERLPFANLQSQSDADHQTLVSQGVMAGLRRSGQISPTTGVTTDALSAQPSLTEDFSWLLQDAYTKVKDFMGADSDPTYQGRRFEMIGESEAWRAGAYWDGVKKANGGKGYRTVGFGFNLDSVGHKDLFKETLKVGDDYYQSVYDGNVDITEAQGRKLFDAAVGEAEQIIDNRLKGVELNNQQRLALVSMAYNSPKLIGKNLVSQLKSGELDEAVNEILFKSNGSRSLGLYNRRYEEALTFVGAERAQTIPSYLSYMAQVLPEKYGISLADKEPAKPLIASNT